MIRAIVKDRKSQETLYQGDFTNQEQIDAWSSIRFPAQNRTMLKADAQALHGEDYELYLIEEEVTVIPAIDEESEDTEITTSTLLGIYEIETSDVSSEYQAEAAKLARREAGRVARLKCETALDIIAGWNLERELTAQQITDMQNTFGSVLMALQVNRPDSAKALINAIEPDGTLVTTEMKAEIVSVL